jgi:hypothetical protein
MKPLFHLRTSPVLEPLRRKEWVWHLQRKDRSDYEYPVCNIHAVETFIVEEWPSTRLTVSYIIRSLDPHLSKPPISPCDSSVLTSVCLAYVSPLPHIRLRSPQRAGIAMARRSLPPVVIVLLVYRYQSIYHSFNRNERVARRACGYSYAPAVVQSRVRTCRWRVILVISILFAYWLSWRW